MWMSFCEERRFVRAPSLLSYEGRRRCLKLSKGGVPCPAVLLRDFNPVISRKFSRLKFLDFFHINYSGHVINVTKVSYFFSND